MRYSEGVHTKKAIVRSAGMAGTMSAVQSKTRSGYHSSATPYIYKGCSGYGSNENIKGYGDKG